MGSSTANSPALFALLDRIFKQVPDQKIAQVLSVLGSYLESDLQQLTPESRQRVERAIAFAFGDKTAAFNSRLLDLELEIAFSKIAAGEFRQIGLIIFDLKKQHRINEIFGHSRGDVRIAKFSELVDSQIRRDRVIDYFFRYGGDEFVIIVPDISEENLRILADRLMSFLENQYIALTSELSKRPVDLPYGVHAVHASIRGRKDYESLLNRIKEGKRSDSPASDQLTSILDEHCRQHSRRPVTKAA